MRSPVKWLLAIVAALHLITDGASVRGQEEQKFFGQNKVQYKDFHWRFVQSKHFDVYFYQGGEGIAEFTADAAESALVYILKDFGDYELTNRISFVIYNSHNQFQQTNVLDEYLSEGIGGVTEIFKNRIVLPYEGSYEKFRHVIHHELVHGVMNDYMYGGSLQSMLTGRFRVQIPLWFAEGLAEYSSRYEFFDTNSDMFVRDAVVEGYLPSIDQMSGYAVYTAGPTIFRYIEDRYGKEKVAEFVTKFRVAGTSNATSEAAFGMKMEEFSEKWAMYHRKTYFPDIGSMVSVKEIGKQLTRHDKDGNFYNITPSLSPQGDKIAFLTDKSGYADILLISAIDGQVIKKIVSGEKTPSLEELHWLSPGIGWSPDGSQLVFSAKASDNDALLIVDVATGRISSFKWNDLEGVFGGSWSPDGSKIAFAGLRHGHSDIYVLDLEKREKYKLTDDIFSDSRPVFSRTGKKIAFVSDRRDHLGAPAADFDIGRFDYNQTDVYVINADGSGMVRVTTDEMNDDWPEWGPDDTRLLFTSDRNGVSNLYVADLAAGENYAITNNLSGIFQPSLSPDGKLAAFTGFNKGGFDLFTLKNPFEIKPLDLPLTVSMKKFRKHNDLPETLSEEIGKGKKSEPVLLEAGLAGDSTTVTFSGGDSAQNDTAGRKTDETLSFRNYVFSGYEPDTTREEELPIVTLPERVYKTDSGDYRIRKYKVKFTPDLVYGTAGFNTFIGFQGTTMFAFSDILGNHRLLFGTNLFFDLKNSSFYGSYYYLSRRTDYGLSAFHTAYSFATDYLTEYPDTTFGGPDGFTDSFVRYRYYGVGFIASRPFNKFNRIDFGVTQFTLARETTVASSVGIPKDQIPGLGPTRRSQNTLLSLALTTDNSLFTIFGPFDGHRAQISVTGSPGYGENGLRFVTVAGDYRKYFWFNRYYAVAMRGSGGTTFGRNPQRFFIGGLDNWIAPSFINGDILVDSFEDFLATFVTPVRGSYYYELQGTRYLVGNFEFRFPFVHLMQLGFPLPLFLQQIRGVTFLDIGAAWGGRELELPIFDQGGQLVGYRSGTYRYVDRLGNIQYNRSSFRWTRKLADGSTVFEDVRMGYGFGIRAFIGFFVLRYDLAWNIMSPRFNGGDAKHYFSIGYDF